MRNIPCCRYQIAVIVLIYLYPLLVMLRTYSLVGMRLWGGEIPREASDHYQNKIQAKRKVSCWAKVAYFLNKEPGPIFTKHFILPLRALQSHTKSEFELVNWSFPLNLIHKAAQSNFY